MEREAIFVDQTVEMAGPVSGGARFGKMFDLRPQGEGVPDAVIIGWLTELAEKLVDDENAGGHPFPSGDHPTLPAGYTYLGQFIDHDLTFDPTRLPEHPVDIFQLTNFRSPSLDLDSVLGFGPHVHPHLYEARNAGALAGRLRNANSFIGQPQLVAHDLPRLPPVNLVPLIVEPRNDENLAIGQLHTAFITFANKVFDDLQAGRITDIGPDNASFAEKTARIVQWHYQWIVLHDFLPRIIEKDILDAVLRDGPKFYKPVAGAPYMPIEFAGAAYRFGHSLVRSEYHWNAQFNSQQATLQKLFDFSSSGGSAPPASWFVNWNRLFEIDTATAVNKARRIDPYEAKLLLNLPGVPPPKSLPVRNLIRGWSWSLPSGQSVAGALGVAPLTAEEILVDEGGQEYKEAEVVERFKLQLDTPLWYYILKEAQVRHNGERLGAVGSTLLAEVFVGLLLADTNSFLHVQPTWKPTLPPGATFTMADLFRYLPPEALNPNGGDTGPLFS